ncbi:hypothetical protein DPMN_130266 [Dreissena polymorpha]|uniref:Uncharacterized protein n=1 Tax=Dreissena polymorpha TaxID=45954 RepID=A0A9D4H4V2_DREPO|nr:hypothetical protein DPMN_130266 [Dreissena polymorpha]
MPCRTVQACQHHLASCPAVQSKPFSIIWHHALPYSQDCQHHLTSCPSVQSKPVSITWHHALPYSPSLSASLDIMPCHTVQACQHHLTSCPAIQSKPVSKYLSSRPVL